MVDSLNSLLYKETVYVLDEHGFTSNGIYKYKIVYEVLQGINTDSITIVTPEHPAVFEFITDIPNDDPSSLTINFIETDLIGTRNFALDFEVIVNSASALSISLQVDGITYDSLLLSNGPANDAFSALLEIDSINIINAPDAGGGGDQTQITDLYNQTGLTFGAGQTPTLLQFQNDQVLINQYVQQEVIGLTNATGVTLFPPTSPSLQTQINGKADQAPNDGQLYAAQYLSWTPFTPGIGDAPADGNIYGRQNNNWVLGPNSLYFYINGGGQGYYGDVNYIRGAGSPSGNQIYLGLDMPIFQNGGWTGYVAQGFDFQSGISFSPSTYTDPNTGQSFPVAIISSSGGSNYIEIDHNGSNQGNFSNINFIDNSTGNINSNQIYVNQFSVFQGGGYQNTVQGIDVGSNMSVSYNSYYNPTKGSYDTVASLSCTGPAGPQGPQGDPGPQGPPGAVNSVNNTGAAISMVQNPGSNSTIYIKDLQAGSNISINDNGSYLTINSSGSGSGVEVDINGVNQSTYSNINFITNSFGSTSSSGNQIYLRDAFPIFQNGSYTGQDVYGIDFQSNLSLSFNSEYEYNTGQYINVAIVSSSGGSALNYYLNGGYQTTSSDIYFYTSRGNSGGNAYYLNIADIPMWYNGSYLGAFRGIDFQSNLNYSTTTYTDPDTGQSVPILQISDPTFMALSPAISATNENVSGMQDEISALQDNVLSCENDINTIEANLAVAQGQVVSLQSNVATSQANISTLQTNVGICQTNITNLQSATTTLQTNVSTAQTNIIALQGTTSTLQSGLTTAQSNITTLQTNVSALQSAITNIHIPLEDLTNVSISSAADNQMLVYNASGTNWINQTRSVGKVSALASAQAGSVCTIDNLRFRYSTNAVGGTLQMSTISGSVSVMTASQSSASVASLITGIIPIGTMTSTSISTSYTALTTLTLPASAIITCSVVVDSLKKYRVEMINIGSTITLSVERVF